MFNKLLHLYKKNTEKTPLEDYTTELFVGILQNNEKFLEDFCRIYLELKGEHFRVRSQGKFSLKNHPDCIVDIVIQAQAENEICFIENKVNSKEGYKQLDRYGLVLDKYKERGFNTKLVYCTKNVEPKDRNDHDFLQTKWYKIASFCKKYADDKLISLFINFLNHNGMNTDMTLRSVDLVAMENFARVLHIIEETLGRVKPKFEETFGKCTNNTSYKSFKDQINTHNRFCFFRENILKSGGYSEVLLGLHLSGKMYVQIFVHKDHQKFSSFVKEFETVAEIGFSKSNWGARVYLEQNLASFVNNANSEVEIEKWYISAFEEFKKFIDKNADKFDWGCK